MKFLRKQAVVVIFILGLFLLTILEKIGIARPENILLDFLEKMGVIPPKTRK